MMRAQFPCQLFLILAATDRHRSESHPARILNPQVAQTSDAVDRDDIAPARAGIPKGIVDRYARAHERTDFLRRQIIGNQRYCFRSDDQVIGIAAVEIDPGDFAIDAHGEIPAPALFADETMSSMPANADSLTFRPLRNIASDRIDAAGNFMTRHTWILNARPQTVLHQDIAVADATRFHFHANLTGARLRNLALH